MLTSLNSILLAPLLFAQSVEDGPEWSMVDAFIVLLMIGIALTAICKSSQRH
ncbi:hypothetical protein Pla110_41300 [Polystyrenella longa]|uniref:Uncharacterized protein n=1 Tax=Polystyrenella longa TaxID=2528007 RepID=A0A518CT44_9PLAN|nr:hypothetical protein [Polystyrenella longa]QDU82375.1 hypothetical protein Pla110_41300 [Polystyrenella longa]